MSADCVFCKIASGEIAANLTHSDDTVVAFDDLNPVAPTHVLVVPREHIAALADAGETSGALLGNLLRVASEVAVERGIADSGYRLVINQGPEAGQVVEHLHLHVIGGRTLGAMG